MAVAPHQHTQAHTRAGERRREQLLHICSCLSHGRCDVSDSRVRVRVSTVSGRLRLSGYTTETGKTEYFHNLSIQKYSVIPEYLPEYFIGGSIRIVLRLKVKQLTQLAQPQGHHRCVWGFRKLWFVPAESCQLSPHSQPRRTVNAISPFAHCLRTPDDGHRRPSLASESTLIMTTSANEQARRR